MMNKKFGLFLGLAILAACVALARWPLTATRPSAISTTVDESPDTITAESIKVQSLEREVKRLAARIEVLGREQLQAQMAATASAGPTPSTDEPAPSRSLSDQELHEQRVVYYGAAHEGEPREARSAGAFEASISDAFSKSGHSSLERVDCRSTVCRLEIRHNNRSARVRFADLVFGPLAFGAYHYPSEDATRTIAYVGMPGHPLPMPEPEELDPFAEKPETR